VILFAVANTYIYGVHNKPTELATRCFSNSWKSSYQPLFGIHHAENEETYVCRRDRVNLERKNLRELIEVIEE
jgi:hypothetical protein